MVFEDLVVCVVLLGLEFGVFDCGFESCFVVLFWGWVLGFLCFVGLGLPFWILLILVLGVDLRLWWFGV